MIHASKRLVSANFRGTFPPGWHFIPEFFSVSEQRILLSAALLSLDATGSRRAQRKRKSLIQPSANSTISPAGMFLPDEYYEFSEGHYDAVIRHYREMHLASWPTSTVPGLAPVLSRLHSLLPSPNIQTHLLHLASNGEILPHVDNVSASGTWILGASLGADRILQLESCSNSDETVQVLLPSGSVYIQRDIVRFQYKHAILKAGALNGIEVDGGQRISVMIRDLLDPDPKSRIDPDSKVAPPGIS